MFCTVFVVQTILAQDNTAKVNAVKDFMKNYATLPTGINLLYTPQKVLSPNFYVKNLGFFCKQELKFEAATGIPFKFRLGSMQYCDWMEGKRHAVNVPPMHY